MSTKPGELQTHPISSFTFSTQEYIRSVVANNLKKQPCNLKSLDILKELFLDSIATDIAIFSLNHDLVIEGLLNANELKYFDGFSETPDGTKLWTPEAYDNTSERIKIYKMHGSINWHPDRQPEGDGIIQGRRNHKDKIPPIILSPNPYILVGTESKMQQYSTHPFAAIQCMFLKTLRETDLMVAAGVLLIRRHRMPVRA